MSKQIEVGFEELKKLVSKRTTLKHTKFGFWLRPFMPTGDNMGFEGCAIASVTKAEFLKCASDLLENLEKRGAKLRVSVPTEDFESWLI